MLKCLVNICLYLQRNRKRIPALWRPDSGLCREPAKGHRIGPIKVESIVVRFRACDHHLVDCLISCTPPLSVPRLLIPGLKRTCCAKTGRR